MSKKAITRLFVGGIAMCFVGLVLELAVVGAALAGGVVDFGGSSVVEVNGGLLAGTLIGLAVVGLLAISAAVVAGVASWIGALLNTVQLEDKTWFASLLVLGMVSMGTAAMVAYVLAGPDSRGSQSTSRLPCRWTARREHDRLTNTCWFSTPIQGGE